jgi:F-type H+-transporting ATPase subunit b
MEGLGLDLKLILAQAVNFLILVWLLKKFLYRPVLGVLEKRRRRIEAGLKKTEELEERLKQLEAEKEAEMRKVRQEAQEIVTSAKEAAEGVKEKILAEAKEEARAQIETARAQIEAREAQMMRDLRREIVDLAVKAAEKSVGEELNEKKHHQLIERSLAELEKKELGRPNS